MLTQAERTFFARVADYMVANNLTDDVASNMEAACKAVLERDEQLWLASTAKNEQGEAIRDALAEAVYTSIRQ